MTRDHDNVSQNSQFQLVLNHSLRLLKFLANLNARAATSSFSPLFALVGFHSASHVLIEANACVWTARTVLSTFPFAVLRSEQWNPSPTAIGC